MINKLTSTHRPTVKSIIIQQHTVQMLCFTKRLRGLKNCTYQERLKRRLHTDLILTYKILFGHVNLFDFCSTSTRGHPFKLFKHHTNHCTRSSFFCKRIINVWNSLPSTVNFGSLNCFKQSIGSVDFSFFLNVLNCLFVILITRAAVSVP